MSGGSIFIAHLGILIQFIYWVTHKTADLCAQKGKGIYSNSKLWDLFLIGLKNYSKYGLAFSALRTSASTTNQGLRKSLIHRQDIPHKIVLDQGTYFSAKRWATAHLGVREHGVHCSVIYPTIHRLLEWQSTGTVCWRFSWGTILLTLCADRTLSSKIHLKSLNIKRCCVFKM